MSFASLRRVLRSARKGLCSTCSKTRYPQLEAAGAGHVGCLIYTLETLGQLIADEHRVTAMHVAARKGQISVLIYLVENEMVKEIPRAKNGATPAHDAAGTGNLDCLRYLMKQTNINVNDADGAGQTILHWAVLSGNLDTVRFLVGESQAAIDATDKNGLTAFHIAAIKNYLPVLKFLAGYAYQRHPKPQRLLNAKNKSGVTPICCAAQAGHVEIVRWLATKGGGDPTIPTVQGMAPLHVATMAGQLEAVKYLYQFGSATAFGGLRSSDGSSALHFAAASGFVDIMKWLLEQKHCTGDEVDQFQRTPLHYAAERGQLKAIQVLCEHNVNVLLEDDRGNLAVELTDDPKCSKYLETVMKRKKPAMGAGPKAKVTDRAIDPQSPPLPAFMEEDEIPFENDDPNEKGWETLQDLMNQSEIQQLSMTSPGNQPNVQEKAERKRRELEEKLRKEEEERRKRREELAKQEDEAAKKIRQQLTEEDPEELKLPVRKNGRVSVDHESQKKGESTQLKSSYQEGNAAGKMKESDTKNLSLDKGTKGLFSKFWSKKNETRPTSPPIPPLDPPQGALKQQDPSHQKADGEPGDLQQVKPRAPRRRGKVPGEEGENPAISDAAVSLTHFLDEVKGPTAVPSSSPPHGRKGLHRKPTPHPYRQGKPPVPSSPTGDTVTKTLNFDYTPLSSPSSESVNSVSPFNSPSPAPSLSPPMSPSPSSQTIVGSGSQSPVPMTPTTGAPKRMGPPPPTVPPPSAPILSPRQTKPQSLHNGFKNAASDSALLQLQQRPSLSRQISLPSPLPPPSSPPSAHHGPSSSPPSAHHRPSSSPPRADSPTMDDIEHQLENVMKILATNAIGRPHLPKGEPYEQEEDDDSGSGSSSSSDEEEEGEDGEEEEEEGSSSEEEGDTAQPPHRRKMTPPITVHRPVMARNAGMNRTVLTAGLNNVRKQTRYPRLLKKRVVNLDTIEEIQDEIIHQALTEDDQAYIFYRIHVERRTVQAWRRYVILAKITQRKAQALMQKRQRDLLVTIFTAWKQALKFTFPEVEEEEPHTSPPVVRLPPSGAVTTSPSGTTSHPVRQSLSGTNSHPVRSSQSSASLQPAGQLPSTTTEAQQKVRHSLSMGAISSTNLNKSKSASVQSIPQLHNKEAYMQWMNQHHKTQHNNWQDVMTSLQAGVSIIQALATASGRNAPRYNANPKLPLHRQDNWKVAYEFMRSIGVNVKGTEPADLASGSEPAVCNMFSSILKWQDSSSNNYSVL